MAALEDGKLSEDGGITHRGYPEVYLVKIYNRRLPGDSVAGTIESLASGAKQTFREARELMEFLASGMGRWNDRKPPQADT